MISALVGLLQMHDQKRKEHDQIDILYEIIVPDACACLDNEASAGIAYLLAKFAQLKLCILLPISDDL